MTNPDQKLELTPDEPISIQDLMDVVRGDVQVELPSSPDWKEQMEASAEFVREQWTNEREIYGVNTGVGDTSYQVIPAEQVEKFPERIVSFHGCGLGDYLDEEQTTAVLLVRLISLINPPSGVRIKLLERLRDLINHRVLPLIPEEGSVGASGDLTPLSYIAAVLMGKRSVRFRGETMPAQDALTELDLEPLTLVPKESLAVMNGTSVMSGLAALALDRARYLMHLSTLVTATSVTALNGNPDHFDQRIFDWKPHPGQGEVARRLRTYLGTDDQQDGPSNQRFEDNERPQDRYSLRCAPHIIGVLADALPWMTDQLETEINSSNDNPLVDAEQEDVLHGGNFYGGHVAFIMDSLKNLLANLADLLDRQMAQLVDPKMNRGLPANLTGTSGDESAINHGLKGLQIGVSAWAAEALNHTSPSSAFSRSTESHNQDKVSMGTIASRDCLRTLELAEQTTAAVLLGAVQGLELRLRNDELNRSHLSKPVQKVMDDVRDVSPFLEEDRELDDELRVLVDRIRSQEFDVGDPS